MERIAANDIADSVAVDLDSGEGVVRDDVRTAGSNLRQVGPIQVDTDRVRQRLARGADPDAVRVDEHSLGKERVDSHAVSCNDVVVDRDIMSILYSDRRAGVEGKSRLTRAVGTDPVVSDLPGCIHDDVSLIAGDYVPLGIRTAADERRRPRNQNPDAIGQS